MTTPPPAPSPAVKPQARKILLVEDDKSMAEFVMTLLQRHAAYQVVHVANGLDAIRYLSREKVDLILTDILMPEMDGIELIQKRAEFSADTPVIAFSGGGYRLDQAELLKYAEIFGAKVVMQKPVDPQALLDAISRVLAESAR